MRFRDRLKASMALLLCVLVVIGISLPASATDPGSSKYKIVYDDGAGIIKSGKEDIIAAMEKLSFCGNVGFITTDDITKSGTDFFKEEYFRQFGSESGAIFYIDMYDRNLYIWTDGQLGDKLTIGACNTITDNVYRDASAGNYTQATLKAFDLMYRKAQSMTIPQPMKYTCNAIVALFASLFIVYLIIRSLNKEKMPSSGEWLGYINYHCKAENVKSTMTTCNVQNISGGGGGFHGGHGGGFHGGGGGFHGGHGGGHHF